MHNKELQLDPQNPPKYCPQCRLNGKKSKVKTFTIDNEKVVMCKNDKCPWPFSVVSKEEATIKVVPSTTAANNTGKKRKKEKPTGTDTVAAENGSSSCDNSIESSHLGSDKCKSPNSKKLKLADKGKTTPEISEEETTEPKKDDDKDGKTNKSRRLGSKEKDIINYLNENFPSSPKETPLKEDKALTEPERTSKAEEPDGGSSSEAARKTSQAEEDARLFRAMPVVVRQPIKVPRHAANIFSSRAKESEERSVSVESPDSGSSDLECSGLSDLDDSDSELESLVSECSTMTAASESSSLASGGEGEGCGKKKRRGKKKKRKDRRKAHAGKCSKEQPRSSDLSLLVTENTENIENSENFEPAEESKVAVTEEDKPRVVKTSDGSSLKIRIKLGKPPASAENNLGRKSLRIKAVNKSTEEPAAMSVTPEEANQEDKVSRMSTQSSVSNISNMSLAASEPPAVMSVSPGEPVPDGADSPESDEEMSDLSTFQFKWKNFSPLSPMSVGDDQEIVEREKSLKKKILKPKPPPLPSAAPAPPTTSNTGNALSQNIQETENVGFKEPASVSTPTRVRPTSHPSPGYSVPSPRMSEPSKCFSLPNLLSPMAPTPKSCHEDAETSENTKVEDSKKKSSSLDSIIQNLSVDKNERIPDRPVPAVLPDGPYPRRRGRKSLAKKFQSEEKSPEENVSELPAKPPDTPTRKGRGRPSKNNSKATPATPVVEESSPVEKNPAVSAPVKTVQKVIKLVNGRKLPPGLVPCAPPPGAKLVPCSPPKHLIHLNKNKTVKPSLFDLEQTDNAEIQPGKNGSTENQVDNPVYEESAMVKPAKTFSRVTKKVPVTVATSLSIETTVLPQESSIDLKTLSLANFESEDPDFALVKKHGAGISFDKESSLTEPARDSNSSQETVSPKKDNSVVFHVSNQAMINQPTGCNNLEVKEQGATKVLLTADSNLIEVHDLKAGNTARYQNAGPLYRGRGRGRGPINGRFIKRDGVLINQENVEAPTSGDGWFQWRDWRVNESFLLKYTDYIDKLVDKHKDRILQTSNKIDPRISALLCEKERNVNNLQIMKTNDFFAQVFVKYLYLKTNFKDLSTESIINVVSSNYNLDNIDFAKGLRLNGTTNSVPSSTTNTTMQLPVSVKNKMIATALSQKPDEARPVNPPASPSQPINLSLSATDVPLPPSPTSPAPPTPSASEYPSLPSIQSLHPATPGAPNTHRGLEVKTEPTDEDYSCGSVQVASVGPASCQVYSQAGCSVQLASVCPSPGHVVGSGPKILQFFYQNPKDDIKIGFPPVRVTTDEEVNCVVALVTEKAEDFNRRNNLCQKDKPVQYYSSAVQARSILQPDILRHIERCFTKKGMKDMAPGRKKRAYPKRKEIIKVPSTYFNKIKEENGDIVDDDSPVSDFPLNEEEAEDDVDEVESEPEQPVVEHVPTESEMTEGLECEVFGGKLPKVKRRIKGNKLRNLERKGRGGRNEILSQSAPDNLVLGVVDHLLEGKEEQKTKEGSLNLPSLFKRRGRRKKKREKVDVFSDEDDYVVPSYAVKSSVEGSRKSKRITMRVVAGELGEKELLDRLSPTGGQQSEKENLDTFNIHEVSPVRNVSEKSSRDQKLEEIREICSEKLAVVDKTVTSSHRFVEPGSGSEDEQTKKVRLKRGMTGGAGRCEMPTEVSTEDVDEMIRCVSRASRPSSQASSRPGSQLSRPASALPTKIAKKLESLSEPEVDSPVLTPRMRRKEAIEKNHKETLQKAISPRAATPVAALGASSSLCENYLKKNQPPASKPLGAFEQAFARKKQAEKIRKLLNKQMRKAEKSKKYQGFGDQKAPEQDESRRKERKEHKKKEIVVKKAQVSKVENDLMRELLELGETAVAAASNPCSQSETKIELNSGNIENGISSTHVTAIRDFEEFQTIPEDSQNLSDELDQLFELK